MFRSHRQQVLDAQRAQLRVDRMGCEIRENVHHPVLDGQQAVRDRQADRAGGEALRHRIHAVRRVRLERSPVGLGHGCAAVQKQERMQVKLLRLGRGDELRRGGAR